jgi:hypothetical protein
MKGPFTTYGANRYGETCHVKVMATLTDMGITHHVSHNTKQGETRLWTEDFRGAGVPTVNAHFDPSISIFRNSPVSSKDPSPTRPARIVVSEAARTGALEPST